MSKAWRPERIEDHGLISDGQTAALVHRDGTIDWLCMPRYDSEACLAALLGDGDNGGWWMAPEGEVTGRSRRYLGDTLILETVIETAGGSVAIIDFLPVERRQAPDIVRIVEGRSGCVKMCSHLALRFDNGRTHPLTRSESECEAVAIAGPNAVVLRFDAPIEHGDRAFVSRFTVKEGERCCFTMTWFPSYRDLPDPVDPLAAYDEARSYWEKWASRFDYDGPDRPIVMRSLLLLKGLIHQPTGGIVAAATASLPERPGGDRNWDYRYCWLRDATFTLLAFHHAGYHEEARRWVEWLRRAVAGEPIEVQPFYRVDGGRHTFEWEAEWLAGFGGAKPVRFGNAAVSQLQLDVSGEVIDAIYLAGRKGLAEDGDVLVHMLADRLETLWRKPDAGIWESRGPVKHHVYSKVMCWVAFDRAARWMADRDRAAADRWRGLANEVRQEVLSRGFDKRRNSFVRAYGDDALDAALLRLPLVGFLDAKDERMLGTVAAIERELLHDGFVRRYSPEKTDDGIGGDEGAFLAVSCWLADVYTLQDRRDDARAIFDRLCAAANDLGLLSEEVSLKDGRALGNIPQALSHLALVNTALGLAHENGPLRPQSRE